MSEALDEVGEERRKRVLEQAADLLSRQPTAEEEAAIAARRAINADHREKSLDELEREWTYNPRMSEEDRRRLDYLRAQKDQPVVHRVVNENARVEPVSRGSRPATIGYVDRQIDELLRAICDAILKGKLNPHAIDRRLAAIEAQLGRREVVTVTKHDTAGRILEFEKRIIADEPKAASS